MDRREIALAAPRRRDTAHAADRDGARRDALRRKVGKYGVERDAMAAGDHEVGRARLPDARDLRARAGIDRGAQRVDFEETVGLRERGNRPGTFADRKRDRPLRARDQRDQHELLAAELGGNAHRHGRIDLHGRFRRQARLGADHRRHKGVEREDRRGRKARQHHDRLALRDREAERLSRLERDAVHDHARACRAATRCGGRDRPRLSTCRPRAPPCRSRATHREPQPRARPRRRERHRRQPARRPLR